MMFMAWPRPASMTAVVMTLSQKLPRTNGKVAITRQNSNTVGPRQRGRRGRARTASVTVSVRIETRPEQTVRPHGRDGQIHREDGQALIVGSQIEADQLLR